MKKTTILLFILSACYFSLWADDCGPQPTPVPTGGFKIRAFYEDFDAEGPFILPDRNRAVTAQWRQDLSGAAGNNRGPIAATTDDFGDINVNDGRAPAKWNFGETNGFCAGQSIVLDVQRGKQRSLYCLIRGIGGGSNAFPSSVEAESTPEEITVYGDSFAATNGMPLLRYFDMNGVLVAEAYADQVSSDGTWLTGSTSDLSSVGTGDYTIMICNANGDGTYETAGLATMEVFHYYEPPPDPDPCGGCSGGGDFCVQMPCNVY